MIINFHNFEGGTFRLDEVTDEKLVIALGAVVQEMSTRDNLRALADITAEALCLDLDDNETNDNQGGNDEKHIEDETTTRNSDNGTPSNMDGIINQSINTPDES